MEELLGCDGFELSLVHLESYQVATVTLTTTEPAQLVRCTPGHKIYLEFPGTAVRLVIDCDFHGLTPLYAAEEPTVE
jgi:hypothetical protein